MSTDTDLRSWAAYVAGHHAITVRLWQQKLWEHMLVNKLVVDPSLAERLATEIRELGDGLRALEAARQADPCALAATYRASSRFEATCKEMTEEWVDTEAPRAPGYRDWQEMVAASSGLAGPPQELARWSRLGAAVGRSQYRLGAEPDIVADFIPEEVGSLRELVREMGRAVGRKIGRMVRKTVREITAPASTPSLWGWWSRIDERFLAVSELDHRLRSALRDKPGPERQLVLSECEITFFGETRPLTAYPRTEMGCLWVLARHTGERVPRQDIIDEANLQTDEDNLKWVIHRLRKILEKLYLARRGGDVPDFITGPKGPRNGRGPYVLNLPRGRVRVDLPSPPWLTTQSRAAGSPTQAVAKSGPPPQPHPRPRHESSSGPPVSRGSFGLAASGRPLGRAPCASDTAPLARMAPCGGTRR